MASSARTVKQSCVLSLDGGGVRGLSTLLILKDLLCKIQILSGSDVPIRPKEVFDVIVGTSTGGLIALMIVKLDLDIDQCIHQYKELSGAIFGKPRFLGRWTGGIVRPRYSGELVRNFVVKLIADHLSIDGESVTLEHTSAEERVHCTVVCREIENSWRKTRMPEPVFLCTHQCRLPSAIPYETCKMCDAACATSAAPTYFEVRRILNKTLVDGGFGETNNPSFAALTHYRLENEAWSLPLDEQLVWVNIGTGTPPPDTTPAAEKRSFWSLVTPGSLHKFFRTMNDVAKLVTDCRLVVKFMEKLQTESRGMVQYSRFSVDNGLLDIGLDKYQKVNDHTIENLTRTYLEKTEVQAELTKTAQSLAEAWKCRQVIAPHTIEINSPIPDIPKPESQIPTLITSLTSHLPVLNSPDLSVMSPNLVHLPQHASLIFPDDLSVQDLPALTRAVATDEASERPLTPQPPGVQPVPRDLQTGSQKSDIIGSGQQFLGTQLLVTIRNNDETARDHALL